MKNLDQVIGLFTSMKREDMQYPVSDNGNIIATNGHILVIAPEKYFAKKYEAITEKFPAYQRIIPEHDKDKILFTTGYKFVYDESLLLPHEDIFSECERCEGDGYLYTAKQSQVNCDECDGSGQDQFLGNLIPTPILDYDDKKVKSFIYSVGSAFFNCNYLQNISRLALPLNEQMKWVRNKKSGANIIYVADIMIILMPMDWGEKEDKEYCGQLTKIEIPTVSCPTE